jgi:hypothetical protein
MKGISALLLSLFVFIGSINIVVNQHLCNGDLESTALFMTAQACEHANPNIDLPPCHKKAIANKKKCCSENSFVLKSVDWLKINSVYTIDYQGLFAFTPIVEHALIVNNYSHLNKYSPEKIPKPPDDAELIYLDHQAFLL